MERDIQTLCRFRTRVLCSESLEKKTTRQHQTRVRRVGHDYIWYRRYNDVCHTDLSKSLNEGVAPEMARMVLPQNLYTEWYWSGTLYAFSRVCNLRCAEDTQSETRTIADGIQKICAKEFPISWRELFDA